ncbi:hypothetical protein ACHAXT_011233 [Thalassiosira profunda]
MSFLRSPPRKAVYADADNPHRRVVLLLDMDCFYAQCEVVRLGLDREMPLALVQWSSALAVNYPARKFGIKRGDSFEVIRSKSKGECVAIHLPVTPVDEDASASPQKPNAKEQNGDGREASPPREAASVVNGEGEVDSSQSAYDEEFNQPQEVREEMYKMEKNRMRSPSEGKACLDRYRLASARIFSLIDDTLAEKLGRKNFILERASIDELFIDVTAFCYKSVASGGNADEKESDATMQFSADSEKEAVQSLHESVICHEASLDSGEKDDQIGNALRLGCHVARTVRRVVFDQLQFTLSAGISTSKLVSKLAASYGKPNGQAVVYPGALAEVMEETQVNKARLLGGKLGKRVLSLMPDNETTMGSIARLLPLDTLAKAIGEEQGRWVFDACRGIDHEEVRATLKVLPKSITAFKSFPKVSYPELEKWTTLLAKDIMKRVELDNARNSRIPRSVTVGYTMKPGGSWIGQSFRLAFPSDRDFNARVQKLVDNTRKMLTERGHSSFFRIGFSAIDFVERPKVGIDSFFSKGAGKTQPTATTKLLSEKSADGKKEASKPSGIDSFFSVKKSQTECGQNDATRSPKQKISSTTSVPQKKAKGTGLTSWLADDTPKAQSSMTLRQPDTKMTDEEMARQLQESYDNAARDNGSNAVASTSDDTVDKDETFALQLQSTFDRENAVLSHVERFSGKRKQSPKTKKKSKGTKRGKIDFFLKK